MIDWDAPDPGRSLQPGYAGPPATAPELFSAARRQYQAIDLSTTRNLYAGRLGKDVVAALRQRGRTGFTGADGRAVKYGDDALRSDYVLNPTVAPRIWADVAAERERNPSFLTGAGNAAEFDAAIIAARRRDYDESSEVLGRGKGLTDSAASFAGSVAASFEDPLQLGIMAVTAPVGGAGVALAERLFGGKVALGTARRIGIAAVSEGVVNAAATVPVLPVKAANMAELGLEYSAGDAALDLAISGAAGAVLGGIGQGIGGAMSVRRIAREMKALDRPLTPAEADAVAVLDSAARDIAASPYPPTPEGDAAHGTRLSEAVDALENDRPVNPAVFDEPAPAPKPAPIVEGFDPAPYLDRAIAYARDRKAGPLTADGIAEAFDLTPMEGYAVLSSLASSGKARGLIIAGAAKEGRAQKFRRPIMRRGPVDLLTEIADAGGVQDTINPSTGRPRHDLAGTMGRRMIGGSGPVIRKNGMKIDELGEYLYERGWFPGQDRPTEADILDLLDRAHRDKIYHPEEVEASLIGEANINDQWEADYRERIAAAAKDMNVEIADEADIGALLQRIGGGMEVDAAVELHINDRLTEAMAEARASLDGDDYEAAFFGDDDGPGTADRTGGADRGGRAAAPGNAGEGGAGGAQPDSVAADAATDGQRGPYSAADAAAGSEALEGFDSPQGDGPAAQTEALEHDLRAEVGAAADNTPPAKTDDDIAAARDAFAEAGGSIGAHGPIHADLSGDYAGAVARLTADQDGEVPAVLSHPEIGKIDLIYGKAGTGKSDGQGLAKLLRWHPDVVANLPELLQAMTIRSRSANRIQLQSATHRAAVRLEYDGRAKTWLLTAFQRDEPAPGVTQDRPASPLPPGRTSYSGPEQASDIAPNAGADNGEAAPIGDTATGSLGLDAEQAPPAGGMTEAQRAEMAARLQQSQMRRGGQQAADQMAGGPFDAGRDQIDIFALPDGRAATPADLLAEFDADDAAIQQLRGCL
ncbi:MAG: hypothetical protein ACOYLS_01280 [Polymorphobacter sp.]